MSTKITPLLEKALIAGISTAADIVAQKIFDEGVPTTEIMNRLITEALVEAGSALSQKGADMLTVEALKGSDSRKVNFGTFLGMIKGKCVTLGMRARNVYDLELLMKTVAPAATFNMSSKEAMTAIKTSLASLPTKISAVIASYVSQGGISKSAVLEEFSNFDEQLMVEIFGIVEKVVVDVIDRLGGSSAGQ